jgi:hypothetical protein
MADFDTSHRHGRHRARRAETFGVRRWLQVGAASAGMGAALLGFSLLGPQTGVAAADDGSSSASSSSSSSESGSSAGAANDAAGASTGSGSSSSSDGKGTAGGTTTKRPQSTVSAQTTSSTDDGSTTTSRTPGSKATAATTRRAAATKPLAAKTSSTDSATKSGTDAGTGTADTATDAAAAQTQAPQTTTGRAAASTTATTATSATTATPVAAATVATPVAAATTPPLVTTPSPTDPWVTQATTTVGAWEQVTNNPIIGTTLTLQSAINSMPLPPQLRDALLGTLWTVRKTFFNLAPDVTPVTVVSGAGGTVTTGRVVATDPEGDPITYRISQGPSFGTVDLQADGTYTYTPNSGFTGYDGVDTFVVSAVDGGVHFNLLDPLRGPTNTAVLFNQDAVKFQFNFIGDEAASAEWDDAARAALGAAAKQLGSYFIVNAPVHLVYNVNSIDDSTSDVLSSASSNLVSGAPGFQLTVVQNKIETGYDANGAEVDGTITWNWGHDWSSAAVQPAGSYDITSTALHEMIHSLGWVSFLDLDNAGQTTWTIYDSYLGSRSGVRAVGSDGRFNSAVTPNLTGGGTYGGASTLTGLYFLGANAMAANGGNPVPIYSPGSYLEGSSFHHLDDSYFSGANHQLMNAFVMIPGERTLSSIELGVLKDLGYNIAPVPTALLLIGFVFVRRMRKRV